MRKGTCFATIENKTCSNPRSILTTQENCCCSKGAGWSEKTNGCHLCPSPGSGMILSYQFLNILIFYY
jgi:hypothetical protein